MASELREWKHTSVGLAAIFGESVGVNVFDLIASSEHQSETQPGGSSARPLVAVGRHKIAFIWQQKTESAGQTEKKKNPDELEERASVQKCAESNLTILLCSVIQAKHS